MREIQVEHLARVEGHGNIEVVLDGDEVKKAILRIYEGPRFFERLLIGRRYYEVPDIVARICSICPDPYQVASSRAMERAMGIRVDRQVEVLRELQLISDVIHSHALHLFFLALPDFMGYKDAMSMLDKYSETVKLGLKVKRAGNAIKEVVTGRTVHGVVTKPGGYTRVPRREELERLAKQLEESIEGAREAIRVFSSLPMPEFARESNQYIAVDPGDAYGYSGDHLLTSDGERYPVERYMELTNEVTVGHSSAKHSSYKGRSFMTGALARLLLNRHRLYGEAREAYGKLEDKIDPSNPFSNNLAQAVELLYSVERAVDLINGLLDEGIRDELMVEVSPRAGEGVAVVEAPRGLLYHHYKLNDKGEVVFANIVTPTAQNAANMDHYLRIAARNLRGLGDEELKLRLEMLVRAYDPCISCSVHLIRLRREP
ncbi:MAG: Ni/Fe hydrogenase subunit alpha [Candidatus Korarchaeum sp.]